MRVAGPLRPAQRRQGILAKVGAKLQSSYYIAIDLNFRRTCLNEEEFVSFFALGDDVRTRLKVDFLHCFQQVGQLLLWHTLE